jgi:hypothetical protein
MLEDYYQSFFFPPDGAELDSFKNNINPYPANVENMVSA